LARRINLSDSSRLDDRGLDRPQLAGDNTARQRFAFIRNQSQTSALQRKASHLIVPRCAHCASHHEE
jgi:hypothetical protein